MKKIILFLLFLGTFSFGDSKFYIGTGAGYSNVTTNLGVSLEDEQFNEEVFRVKLGYGDREAYAVEISTDYINSDEKKYAFDISILKAYDLGIYINPFAKVGFGAGVLDEQNNQNQSLTYGSFHIGGGIFIPINEHFDIEVAYEYKNRSYQKANELDYTQSRTSHINFVYAGINFRY